MKILTEKPNHQLSANALKLSRTKERRLDAKLVVMIEESINNRCCELKKLQNKEI